MHHPKRVTELDKKEVGDLVAQAREVLREERCLINLQSKRVLFVGDTHGDFLSTISVVRKALGADYDHIVFLGDYVDRGPQQIENINYVIALKLYLPDVVVLLRGNHETPEANAHYGFHIEASTMLSPQLYDLYAELFSQMPYAVFLDDGVIGIHGGIAKGLSTVRQIENLPRGEVSVYDRVAYQLLWNDPREGIHGFQPSWRGAGIYFFGQDAFEEFALKNGVRMLIRAHEVFREGYHQYFEGKVLSIFSARHYGVPINAKVAVHERDGTVKVIPV